MPYKTKEAYDAYIARRKTVYAPRLCPICCNEFQLINGRTRAVACIPCYKEFRSLYSLIHAAKYRANKNGLEFNLTINWAISQSKVCPKTGFQMSYSDNGNNFSSRNPLAASIDKIDASKGYTQDNCQIVCWWYNVTKQDFPEDQVIKLCQAVVDTFAMKAAQNV